MKIISLTLLNYLIRKHSGRPNSEIGLRSAKEPSQIRLVPELSYRSQSTDRQTVKPKLASHLRTMI